MLRQAFPNATLTYCSNRFRGRREVLAEEVIALSPHIRSTVSYYVEDSPKSKRRDFANQLGKIGLDDLLVYVPHNLTSKGAIIRDWLFFRTLGFRRSIGFAAAWRWSSTYLNSNSFQCEGDRLCGILSEHMEINRPRVCQVMSDEPWQVNLWEQWALDGHQVVAVCPGTKMQSKRWPKEYFIDVGRQLNQRRGMRFVIIGGPQEESLCAEIQSAWRGFGFAALGANLFQTAAIIRASACYFGNDTGSMHLAASMGVPCVAIFSSREKIGLWYPYGSEHVVFRSDAICSPCQLMECFSERPPCLIDITPELVASALEAVCARREPEHLREAL